MDESNLVPVYYTVSNDLNESQIASVQHALRITPIFAAIVTSAHDGHYASTFSDKVITTSFNYAHRLAIELDQPVIIILGKGFNAYYANGRSEEISI